MALFLAHFFKCLVDGATGFFGGEGFIGLEQFIQQWFLAPNDLAAQRLVHLVALLVQALVADRLADVLAVGIQQVANHRGGQEAVRLQVFGGHRINGLHGLDQQFSGGLSGFLREQRDRREGRSSDFG